MLLRAAVGSSSAAGGSTQPQPFDQLLMAIIVLGCCGTVAHVCNLPESVASALAVAAGSLLLGSGTLYLEALVQAAQRCGPGSGSIREVQLPVSTAGQAGALTTVLRLLDRPSSSVARTQQAALAATPPGLLRWLQAAAVAIRIDLGSTLLPNCGSPGE